MWNRDGSVKSDQALPVSSALPAEERRVVAWVGKSVIFKGTLISSEDMTIDGHVEGTIEVRGHSLTVGPDADIRADTVAEIVTIYGAVVGNIRASAKVDIRATGRIDGDVIAPSIVMADGAIVHGRVDTSTGQSDATKSRPHLAIA